MNNLFSKLQQSLVLIVHFFSLNSSTPATPSLLGGRSRLHLIDFGCCERTKTLGGSITQVSLIPYPLKT